MPEKRFVSVDSQWMNNMQSCMRKLKYQLIDNLRPSTNPEPLDRGDIIHAFMDSYYKGRMKKEGNHNDLVVKATEDARIRATELDLGTEEVEESIKAAIGSVNLHSSDGWIIHVVEEPFSKILYDSDDLQIISTGVIDLIVEVPRLEGLVIVDHKSSKRASTPLSLSNQFMNYCTCTGTRMAVVNQIGLQKTVPAEQKFRRIPLNYSQANLDEWKENIIFWIKFALQCIDRNYYPMNLTSCDKYGQCIFTPICNAQPEVREWKAAALFVKGKPWDPYTKGK